MNYNEPSITGFSSLGIAPRLLQILGRLRYTTPTPIQKQAIPIAIEGKDVVGIAQTGTGKTLAFGIPMVQRLAQTRDKGLIILPTRELALQVEEVLQQFTRDFGMSTAVLIGGASMNMQMQALRRNPRIIVATPGRLLDHLDHRTMHLDNARIVVLDEADRMLDMGFAPQIGKILHMLPREKQMMLFSATMPQEIMKMATGHMKLPIRIEVAPAGTTSQNVSQEIFFIQRNAKDRLLDKLLEQYSGTTLVFTRTKHTAKRLTRVIRNMRHTAAEIHSNRSLNQRREALEGFKIGRYRILVATDIAARGIDVQGIGLVVNYDVPTNPEDYVHRIGRTARAGAEGKAITFVMPEQRNELRNIERLIRKTLPVAKLPDLPPDRPQLSSDRGHRPIASGFGHARPSRERRWEGSRPAGEPRPGEPRRSFGGRPQRRPFRRFR